MKEYMDLGSDESTAALRAHGENAVQLALMQAPWRQAPNDTEFIDHLRKYIPDEYDIIPIHNDHTDNHDLVMIGTLAIEIPKGVLPNAA